MEIKLNGSMLHQWDTARTVQVTPDEGFTLQQVAFSCAHTASPIIVKPDADGVADIPDGLLRHSGVITVNAMLTAPNGKRTARSKDFPVEAAILPEDYTSGSGGGGGSTSKYQQPEWGKEKNGVILPEMTLEVDPDAGMAMVTSPFNSPIKEGEVYTVIFNGTEYPCTAVNSAAAGGYVLGNGAIVETETPNADAPFMISVPFEEAVQDFGAYALAIPLDGSATFTLSIKGWITHKIGADYLENDVFFVSIPTGTGVHDGVQFTVETPFLDILSAIRSGRQVYLSREGGEKYGVLSWSNVRITFSNMLFPGNNLEVDLYAVNPEGVCTLSVKNFIAVV